MPAGLREDVGVELPPSAGDPVRDGVKSSSSMRLEEVLGPADTGAAPAPLRLWRPLLCADAMLVVSEGASEAST